MHESSNRSSLHHLGLGLGLYLALSVSCNFHQAVLTSNKSKDTGGLLPRPGAFLGLLPQVMNPINCSAARSLFPLGRDCQFQAAAVSVAGKCTGAVEKGSGEGEGETDCIFNLLYSLGG